MMMKFGKEKNEEIWVKHYSSNHHILLVGEGDFSFSSSLARAFGSASNIVATSLDPYGKFACLLLNTTIYFSIEFAIA